MFLVIEYISKADVIAICERMMQDDPLESLAYTTIAPIVAKTIKCAVEKLPVVQGESVNLEESEMNNV